MTGRLDELAARTPATRDRYVDFLRAASILVVVAGHWLVGVLYWEDGVIGSTSAIGRAPWLWIATWFLQVMPIFFFVGGFSNLVTYRAFRRRGDSTWEYVRSRLARLLRPTLIFIGAWAVIQVVLHLLDVGAPTTPFLRGMRPPGATIPFGPLWFLAVYAGVLVLSPVMIRLHERFGLSVVVVMLVGAVASDAIGFITPFEEARWANVAFVWFLPHQLGFFYADGKLTNLSRPALWGLALGGLAALLLLTNPIFGDAGREWFPGIGHYPKSLLGTDVERITNTYPPTIPLVAMAFWSIGLALLLRDRLTRWLQRDRPWKATIFVNSLIMTLFLWHMTAFLLAVLVLWPLGFGQQGAPTAGWWLERPLWVGVSAVFLTGLVAVFGRFERPRHTKVGRRASITAALLMLASCGNLNPGGTAGPVGGPSPVTPLAEEQRPGDLWNRSFVAVRMTLNGRPSPLDADSYFNVVFDELDGVIRWGNCNATGSKADITKGRLLVREGDPFDIAYTEIGCLAPLQEQLFASTRFLLEDPSWRLRGTRLTLATGDSVVELEETEHDRSRPDPLPTDA